MKADARFPLLKKVKNCSTGCLQTYAETFLMNVVVEKYHLQGFHLRVGRGNYDRGDKYTRLLIL